MDPGAFMTSILSRIRRLFSRRDQKRYGVESDEVKRGLEDLREIARSRESRAAAEETVNRFRQKEEESK